MSYSQQAASYPTQDPKQIPEASKDPELQLELGDAVQRQGTSSWVSGAFHLITIIIGAGGKTRHEAFIDMHMT
jgi:hypothetical protein